LHFFEKIQTAKEKQTYHHMLLTHTTITLTKNPNFTFFGKKHQKLKKKNR